MSAADFRRQVHAEDLTILAALYRHSPAAASWWIGCEMATAARRAVTGPSRPAWTAARSRVTALVSGLTALDLAGDAR